MLIHIKVFGRVQGVGFRAWARREATALDLSGWVRNRIGGAVEIMAEGSTDQINLFLSACRKGPSYGRVDRVEAVCIPDAPLPPIEQGTFTTHPTV